MIVAGTVATLTTPEINAIYAETAKVANEYQSAAWSNANAVQDALGLPREEQPQPIPTPVFVEEAN